MRHRLCNVIVVVVVVVVVVDVLRQRIRIQDQDQGQSKRRFSARNLKCKDQPSLQTQSFVAVSESQITQNL